MLLIGQWSSREIRIRGIHRINSEPSSEVQVVGKDAKCNAGTVATSSALVIIDCRVVRA